MAKPSKKENNETNNFRHYDAPEGYKDRNQDPEIWNPDDGPIHFIPISARLVDSKKDENKYSILVLGILAKSCRLRDRDDNPVDRDEGDAAAVWVAGGNRKLPEWAGTPVFMYQTGETIDTKKGNPMKVYRLLTPEDSTRKLVRLDADFRKMSRDTNTPWDRKQDNKPEVKRGKQPIDNDFEGLEDIPF